MADKNSRKIKVLMVGPHPPPPGGMANYIQNLESSNLKERYEIRAFDTDYPRLIRKLRPFSIAWLPIMYLQYRSVLLDFKPDIVHIHTPSFYGFIKHTRFMSGAKNTKMRVIMHVHAGKFRQFYEGLCEYGKGWVRRELKKADRLVVLSNNWRDFFKTIYPEDSIRIVRNGIQLSSFRPSGNIANRTGCRFIYVGKVVPPKGIIELIKASAIVAKEHPDFHLRIVGSGRQIHRYLNLSKSLGMEIRIDFVGEKTGQALIDLYNESDIFVLPSYAEGMPLVLLEAMAMKLAVIATNVGAIPEVLTPGGGIIIPPGDTDALAQAMLSMAGKVDVINSMGDENRKIIEREYSFDRVAKEVGEIYEELVPQKPVPSQIN